METLKGAFNSLVNALTPNKKNNGNNVAGNNVKNAPKVGNVNTRKNNLKAKLNENIGAIPPVPPLRNNTNNNNVNVGGEPGSRENVYQQFQSASAEPISGLLGGVRRRQKTKKQRRHRKHRKSLRRR